ncbi:porin family protein [Hymenobacter daeguensis]
MNQKLRCLLLISLGWLGRALTVQAQADFRPGYLVPLSGDTVRGLTDYRGGVRSAELCRFRPTADAPVVAYTPAQLRGYGFASGRYYRTQLLTAIDSVQYQATPPPQPVFMEVLASGPLNLYQLRSKTGVDRFFVAPATQDAARPVTELIPSRHPGSDYLTRAYLRANLYRGVLTELMVDCPAVRITVASVAFTTSALTGVVQRYNACRAPVAATSGAAATVGGRSAGRAGERVKLGVVAGVERSRLSVSGLSLLENGNFASTVPVVGLGLTVPFASISEKLSLRFEALVEPLRYADTFLAGPDFGSSYEQMRLNLTYLRMPLMVRYTYPTGKLRPYAQLGASYAYRLKFDMSVQEGRGTSSGTVAYGPSRTLENRDIGAVNYEIGLAGSVGVQLPSLAGRALAFELRAERSSGLIATTGIGSTQQHYFALLSYNFTK